MSISCLLCAIDPVGRKSKNDNVEYECQVCGKYIVSTSLEHVISAGGIKGFNNKCHILVAHIRERYEHGVSAPKFTSNDFQEIIDQLNDPEVLTKQEILLTNISRRTVYPGSKVELSLRLDYPLAYARNESELDFYLRVLKERRYIDYVVGNTHVQITGAGWEYLNELNTNKRALRQGFVAMSFNNDLNDLWKKAIRPAIKVAGYEPVRIDNEEYNEKICDRIISEIRKSRFVVADFTDQRHGVYFEAGFAHGLGIPVIWTVSSNDVENLHFDTRNYNYIVWEDIEELKEKLIDRIEATII